MALSRGLAADLAEAESNFAATGGRGITQAEYVDTLRIVAAFALGLEESADDVGMTYDGDPDSDRSRAYDHAPTITRLRSRPHHRPRAIRYRGRARADPSRARRRVADRRRHRRHSRGGRGMTAYDAAVYRRARDAGYTAKNALALARWIAADRIELPEYGAPVTVERDGWTITLSLDYDSLSLADLGYGRFLAGVEDWRTGYEQRPDPEAIPNPYRDSRNVSNGDGWYVPGEAGSVAERAAYLHKAGASKSVALDEARAMLAEELRYVTSDYGPSVYVLTAAVSRAGVELGDASVGGIEIAWSDLTRTDGREYLAEVADDLIPEAIADAEAALERLVTA